MFDTLFQAPSLRRAQSAKKVRAVKKVRTVKINANHYNEDSKYHTSEDRKERLLTN
jgi:hypothetical protein